MNTTWVPTTDLYGDDYPGYPTPGELNGRNYGFEGNEGSSHDPDAALRPPPMINYYGKEERPPCSTDTHYPSPTIRYYDTVCYPASNETRPTQQFSTPKAENTGRETPGVWPEASFGPTLVSPQTEQQKCTTTRKPFPCSEWDTHLPTSDDLAQTYQLVQSPPEYELFRPPEDCANQMAAPPTPQASLNVGRTAPPLISLTTVSRPYQSYMDDLNWMASSPTLDERIAPPCHEHMKKSEQNLKPERQTPSRPSSTTTAESGTIAPPLNVSRGVANLLKRDQDVVKKEILSFMKRNRITLCGVVKELELKASARAPLSTWLKGESTLNRSNVIHVFTWYLRRLLRPLTGPADGETEEDATGLTPSQGFRRLAKTRWDDDCVEMLEKFYHQNRNPARIRFPEIASVCRTVMRTHHPSVSREELELINAQRVGQWFSNRRHAERRKIREAAKAKELAQLKAQALDLMTHLGTSERGETSTGDPTQAKNSAPEARNKALKNVTTELMKLLHTSLALPATLYPNAQEKERAHTQNAPNKSITDRQGPNLQDKRSPTTIRAKESTEGTTKGTPTLEYLLTH